ncbi:MAG: S9 family peptidase [Saprospiraceae bacterium]|nr:S9 family peptidase [Saprospiraceae bacterium]
MIRIFLLLNTLLVANFLEAQSVMTSNRLWQLGRVSALGLSKDAHSVIYQVSTPSVEENNSNRKYYSIPLSGGRASEITDPAEWINDRSLSANGQYQLLVKDVKLLPVFGADFYPRLNKSNVQIYSDLNYRHWDEWEDGAYSHLFIKDLHTGQERDLMAQMPYDCPQKPFGGDEDYIWDPDGKNVIYVVKRNSGKVYAQSTNTDIMMYEVETGRTINISEGMPGYDVSPAFSHEGTLAWMSMRRDGYESDKNDIVIMKESTVLNLTGDWDGTVYSFQWGPTDGIIYFNAPVDGTVQLFSVNTETRDIKQITSGDFDITGMVGQANDQMVVTRTDMNHAAEIYRVDLNNGEMKKLTSVNDENYDQIRLSRIERRYVNTTDNKKMLVWVIYPPGFDPNRKYPTLLYCQGGPQSALSQFYSFRWNFQLMAAAGYIVVAPNRRGMPGHGVEWNEQISKDHGGQVMDDYLSAIDALAEESFVDRDRLGCVGASYGGYSVFYLAGIHEGRFKTFISHDGIFDLKSMYGTTEELFFVDWDLGGNYWDTTNKAAMKSYREFDPSNMVAKWDTPMMIVQGGKDYRVPIGQGLEAFQAAQLRGLKSKLVYFPEENHWVLHPQNAIVWQNEFFKWLSETL